GSAHPRCRYHDILFDVLGGALRELDRIKVRSGPAVETPQQERQRFAQMSEGEPRARETIENASEYDAQRMRAGLERPFPRRPPQALVTVQHGRRRNGIGGMHIEESAERLRPLPEWVQRSVVQVLAVGMAIDHGAAEFELAHASFELVRGGGGILHWQMREAGVPLRPLYNFTRQKIVGGTRLVTGGLGVAFGLHARPRYREHAPLNAGAFHRLQPHVPEVGQPRHQPPPPARRQYPPPPPPNLL